MGDLLAIVALVGFFVLTAAYLSWCERIVERDSVDVSVGSVAGDESDVARRVSVGGQS